MTKTIPIEKIGESHTTIPAGLTIRVETTNPALIANQEESLNISDRSQSMKVFHKTKEQVSTYWVKIFISGPVEVIEQKIRSFCFDVGLCVTITLTKYIYTGGEETGVEIGLINYPRYPKAPNQIWALAVDLAEELLKVTHQRSVLVMNPTLTTWISHQDKDPLHPHT